MIKKILGLWVLLLIFFGVNFWYWEWIFHDVNDEFTITNATVFTQKVLSSSAWVVYGGWMWWKAMILLQEKGRRSSTTRYERRYIYFWGTDNKLYAYWNQAWDIANPEDFEYLRFDSFVRYSWTWFVSKDYVWLNDSPWEIVSAESFYNNTQLKSAMTRYAYLYTNTSNNSNSFTAFCRIYDTLGFSICVKPASAITTTLTPVSWLSIDPVEFDTSLLWTSPWTSDISWGGDLSDWWVELWSSESAILYFESKYWWDKSICYAWIDNLTAVYGDSVSFQEWTWLSIFQVFSGLYWNSDLDKVYVWLNSWLINYDQWYERSEPLYLSNYNSWSNQVDLYYTWFTFPFANNPVAIFFLTDNIYNRSEYKTQWSEVVSYCNLKINDWTFEEIIDQAVKDNINTNTQLVNINKWLNPDWSRREFVNVWAFLTSWTDLAFSWNTTIKNTLKNFFEGMDQSLSVVDINTSNRILPTWLVTAFLFVVLFKLLRKR